jgi:hypothetical protein
MSHVSNGWLARHLHQAINRLGPSLDNAAAYERGWQSARLRRGTWSYRDPRFTYRNFAMTEISSGCEFCDDKIAHWLHDEPDSTGRWS